MTDRLHPPMTDERLDRLIDQLFDERAEDVALLALPADAMAERIATRLRPVYGVRNGFALIGALLLLLVALAAAAVIGSRPAPLVLVTPVTFECEAAAPEFTGQQVNQMVVRDETGIVSGCRGLNSDEAAALREALGPPMTFLDGNSVEITKSRADSAHLLVVWVVANCDGTARIDLTGEASTRIDLVVAQPRAGECQGGTGLGAVEISTNQPISPSNVSGRLMHVQSGP